ncbi:hypothetical protein [Streptomyces sp. WP-1]|uniref:hypothetical protein n=1 Tax=Streptomyces sp. WP-1 TaxID=3041497 RepID=UPI00264908E8|nr:hypothetical protein [Streptomyces sp. WP-1]WKE67803.1 hypothetical protein QHG49_01530 [Streptomyces sp. WP-1]
MAVLTVVLLFRAGNAPVEEVTLFDSYCAGTPWIRETILTYLLAPPRERMPDAPGSTAWRSKDLVPLSLAFDSLMVQDLRAHHRFPAESSRP